MIILKMIVVRNAVGCLLSAAVTAAVCFGTNGCGRQEELRFPDHLAEYLSEPTNSGFEIYRQLSSEVQNAFADIISRAELSTARKQEAVRRAAAFISRLKSAQRNRIAFVFLPTSPLAPPPDRKGWRFLGRILAWKVEFELESERYDQAVETFAIALRFGLDLTGGDAMDADLGYSLVRDCAKPLWKSFDSLSPNELRKIYAKILSGLDGAPTLEQTLRHELYTMKAAIQAIQDEFLEGDVTLFEKALGDRVSPAVKYLRELRSKDKSEQIEYFRGFAREADLEYERLVKIAGQPTETWTPPPDPSGTRPWKRFAAHYFRSGRYLMDAWLANEALLRLMAVDAALLARLKEGRGLPSDLSGLPAWLRTDPYSGQDFAYTPKGIDYSLYSFGPDRRDDGGPSGVEGREADFLPPR